MKRALLTALVVMTALDILTFMHQTNLMEIDMGNMAMEKTKSDRVHDYAEMLVADHQRSDKQVTDLAQKLSITIPEQDAAGVDKDHQKMMALQNTKDASFDRAFLLSMVSDHKSAIARLEAARKNADPQTAQQTAQLIGDTLPILRRHQQTANNLMKEFDTAKNAADVKKATR